MLNDRSIQWYEMSMVLFQTLQRVQTLLNQKRQKLAILLKVNPLWRCKLERIKDPLWIYEDNKFHFRLPYKVICKLMLTNLLTSVFSRRPFSGLKRMKMYHSACGIEKLSNNFFRILNWSIEEDRHVHNHIIMFF